MTTSQSVGSRKHTMQYQHRYCLQSGAERPLYRSAPCGVFSSGLNSGMTGNGHTLAYNYQLPPNNLCIRPTTPSSSQSHPTINFWPFPLEQNLTANTTIVVDRLSKQRAARRLLLTVKGFPLQG